MSKVFAPVMRVELDKARAEAALFEVIPAYISKLPLRESRGGTYAVLTAVKERAFITTLDAPDFSSNISVVAGRPALS